MSVRLALESDFDAIAKIYEYARSFMRSTGNKKQWGDSYPSLSLIREDIQKGQLYAVCKDKIKGVFAFIKGDDPTYRYIYNGEWLNKEEYGTIHRIAAAQNSSGMFREALEFCEKQTGNIRIDTHQDNIIMQHLLDKYGFIRCGIIYVEDGSKRIAYHKVIRS